MLKSIILSIPISCVLRFLVTKMRAFSAKQHSKAYSIREKLYDDIFILPMFFRNITKLLFVDKVAYLFTETLLGPTFHHLADHSHPRTFPDSGVLYNCIDCLDSLLDASLIQMAASTSAMTGDFINTAVTAKSKANVLVIVFRKYTDTATTLAFNRLYHD